MVRRHLLLAVLTLAACSAPAVPREGTRDAATEHAQVRSLLYEQGLVEDLEVQARMSAFVLRMRRNGLAPERRYREFRIGWRRGSVRTRTARDGPA